MSLFTFKIGGVHPPEQKLSAQSPIQVLEIPKKVAIPLAQHLGVPAKAVVKKGDMVKVGQLIATGEAFISANIHASVSGKVVKVEPITDSTGFRKESVVIEVEGDQWEETIKRDSEIDSECSFSAEEIIERIHQMGVVGLGGATFPTHIKYKIPDGKKVEYLIINGVECEPYLTADHRLMLEYAPEVLIGIKLMMKALGVKKAVIGIENNKKDAIELMTRFAQNVEGVEVAALQVKYPQGGEKQLIDAVLKRRIPSGKLPIEVGCVVNNVGTAYAVYEAVQKNKPLIERIVTVTGKDIENPANYRVRIGTPLEELIVKAGGDLSQTGKIVNGGPMMGKAIFSTQVPVTKGTSGVVLFPKSQSKRVKVQNCIRCGKCIQVCPMGLEPFLLSILGRQNQVELIENEKVMDCIECGSCVYTCPSGRPLLDHIRLGKGQVGAMIRRRSNK